MTRANATRECGGFRDRRLAAGLTQEQLARIAGCSLAYVRLLEGGFRPAAPAESPQFRAVTAALGLQLDDRPSPAAGRTPD